ncbi:MAG TPA: site-specific recombinase [Aquabacterium sp.]|nr:site-specific recombinase [Aquabacterium sp.]HQC95632.1 site-specific recombinase [Aquabacterium sp.]
MAAAQWWRGKPATWDLTALLNAADPKAARPERHLWLVRLIEWLRHGPAEAAAGSTPRPVLRLRHLLNVLERHPEPRARIVALLGRAWRETDLAALLADFGFSARRDLGGEVAERLSLRLLPATPDTDDGAALFQLLFSDAADADWLAAIDAPTLARLAALLGAARDHGQAAAPGDGDWRAPLLRAITWLVSAIRAAAFTPALRQRMGPELLAERPFEQLSRAAEDLIDALRSGERGAIVRGANFLRALLLRCSAAAASVPDHLAVHGVSVNIVFEVEQLQARCVRLEALLDLALSDTPQRELQSLLVELVRLARERRSLRALLGRQYSLMARKVTERHAETGEHYITRNRAEYADMLRKALGGGAVIGGTTFAKFAIMALGLAPFWAGFGAGLNYAISFLIVHLLHWTVATKQPAMTAPAMAQKLGALRRPGEARDSAADAAAVEGFVDEVTHLVRSQFAGIVGNIAAVIPVVLVVQWLAWWLQGAPLVGEKNAHYVLHSLTLLGPTALFAAFTGVLLFASSLIAGWAENWFVYHRLDSALAHHPGIVARLGAARAQRWSLWWRANISGLAANVSLGLLLGIVPALLAFLGIPLDVRHVTLGTGQLAAAASTLGWDVLRQADFWWCVAGLVATGVLNLAVSFWLALKVALRSRGITLADRRTLYAAVRRRLWQAPRSFFLPERGA